MVFGAFKPFNLLCPLKAFLDDIIIVIVIIYNLSKVKILVLENQF